MLCGIYLSQRRAAIKGWPARERIEFPHLIPRTGHHVHHTAGFDHEEIIDLCIRINSMERGAGTWTSLDASGISGQDVTGGRL
jgi:hypothetical protein